MRSNSSKKELQRIEKQLKKHNKILLFCVILASEPERFLTITSAFDEALEYLDKLLLFENKEHYQSWCNFRELSQDDSSWAEYKKSVLSEMPNKYNIIEVTYDFADIVAILRMFGCCYPIGCSFDTDIEKLYALTKLNDQLNAIKTDTEMPEDDTINQNKDNNYGDK